MPDYKFNHNGTELLELVTMAICAADGYNDKLFFDPKYSLMAISGHILSGRIYSSKEEYINLVNRVIRREPDTISDVQKIITILQDPNDIDGQKVLFNILNGIDKNKIAKDVRDFEVRRIYSNFLYNKGYASSGFRVNDPEINKFLLIKLLELNQPDASDFKMLVENAESFGIPDEDIAKIYGRMKYVYESEGTYVNGELQASGKIVEITKYFKPVKERIERKQQEQQSQQDENMPKTLEEALAEIRRLRKEVSDLKTRNNMLAGNLQMQEMRHGNQNGGMIVQPERQVLNL